MNKNLLFYLLSMFVLQACGSYTAYTQNTPSLPKKQVGKPIHPPQKSTTPSIENKKDVSIAEDEKIIAEEVAPVIDKVVAAPVPFKPIEFESNVTIKINGTDRTFKVEVPNEDNLAFQQHIHTFFVDLQAYQQDADKAAASHTTDKKTSPDKMKELAAQADKRKKEMAAEELKSEQELLKLFNTFWQNLKVGGVNSKDFVILPTKPTGTIEIKTDVGGISATAENDSSGKYLLINKTTVGSTASPTIAQALKDAIDNLLMSIIQQKQKEIMLPAPVKLLSADLTDTASTIRMRQAKTGHIDLRQSLGGIVDFKAPVFLRISGDDPIHKTSGTSSIALCKFNNLLVGMSQTWKNDTHTQSETSFVSTYVFDKAFIELQQGRVSVNDELGTRHLLTLGYDTNNYFTPFVQFGSRQLGINHFLQKESRTYMGATLDLYNEKNSFITYNALITLKGGVNTTKKGLNSLTTFETHVKAQTAITSQDGVTFSTGAEVSTAFDCKLNLSAGFTH